MLGQHALEIYQNRRLPTIQLCSQSTVIRIAYLLSYRWLLNWNGFPVRTIQLRRRSCSKDVSYQAQSFASDRS
jgi:hypothetical protein